MKLITALLVAFLASAARADDAPQRSEIDGLLAQAGQLTAELRTIAGELQQNIAQKRAIEKEMDAVGQRGRALRAEAARYQASGCGRTFLLPREQAAYARCQSWRARLQPQLDGVVRAARDVRARDMARVAAARRLRARHLRASGTLRFIQNRLLRLKAFADGTRQCLQGSLEAMHQCMQSYWDGARRNQQPVVPVRPFRVTPRTQEQAIDAYRSSGPARPGPKSLRIQEVPAP